MKLLKDLLYGVRIQEIIGNTQIAIESICYDSRKSSKMPCLWQYLEHK